MKISSFRSLLLKRASDDPAVLRFIKDVRDDVLLSKTIESLSKMARQTANMGKDANAALVAFGASAHDESHIVPMLREALAHHISHHKASLRAMHSEQDPSAKARHRRVADAHLNRIIPLLHIAAAAGRHSMGAMNLDHVDTRPWEANYTSTLTRQQARDLGLTQGRSEERLHLPQHGAEGLNRRPASKVRGKFGVPDYRYLEMPPHPHPHTWPGWNTEGHEGGYPFETIKLGSDSDVNFDRAWLPIKDVEPKSEYTPHVFDLHPVNHHADMSQSEFDAPKGTTGGSAADDYPNLVDQWDSDPRVLAWKSDRIKKLSDPSYNKGLVLEKPGHHHEGIPLADHPETANYVVTPPPEASSTRKEKSSSIHPELGDISFLPPELQRLVSTPPKVAEPSAENMDWLPDEVKQALAASPKQQSSDDDIISAFDAAGPQEKLKMLPQYSEAMKRKHGGA